ncbi:hypothetical protein J1N35_025084 [Gossypium stocksii]|uniref:CCHC-type domain-containing protein n=1 Tax=Gossypium stocksii TaxID=47602 RepID=A0A9D3V6T2_9ROSI|nr:hypothetical protein J1N35_025084 [Gossypium stocksii]
MTYRTWENQRLWGAMVVRVDDDTENGYRGRFARMAISVDLYRPLILKLRVKGKIQQVEYENLPKVYYECGCFGHMKDICPKVRKEKESEDIGEEGSGHMATPAAKHPSLRN